MTSDRPHICLVALRTSGLLSGRDDIRHVGGAERQQVLIARELVRRGYPVSIIVFDYGQAEVEQIEGIRLVRAYRREAGLPLLRSVHPRLTGLWAAMRRADADIYYQRGAESETGLVAGWCRRHERCFIFAIAHDTNCHRDLRMLEGPV